MNISEKVYQSFRLKVYRVFRSKVYQAFRRKCTSNLHVDYFFANLQKGLIQAKLFFTE